MLNAKVGHMDTKIVDLTKAARTGNAAPVNTTSTPGPAAVQAAATTAGRKADSSQAEV